MLTPPSTMTFFGLIRCRVTLARCCPTTLTACLSSWPHPDEGSSPSSSPPSPRQHRQPTLLPSPSRLSPQAHHRPGGREGLATAPQPPPVLPACHLVQREYSEQPISVTSRCNSLVGRRSSPDSPCVSRGSAYGRIPPLPSCLHFFQAF